MLKPIIYIFLLLNFIACSSFSPILLESVPKKTTQTITTCISSTDTVVQVNNYSKGRLVEQSLLSNSTGLKTLKIFSYHKKELESFSIINSNGKQIEQWNIESISKSEKELIVKKNDGLIYKNLAVKGKNKVESIMALDSDQSFKSISYYKHDKLLRLIKSQKFSANDSQIIHYNYLDNDKYWSTRQQINGSDTIKHYRIFLSK
ncbi:MAG: hypothetical protein ACJAZ3_000693 [Sphingobacteriales bacterium]|jgi:hypothetical protein